MIAIVANGETPQGEALEALRRAECVIACDGAYARLKALGIEPDWVVGDCDSQSEEDRKALGSRLVRVDEQETNDLEKAFRFACEGAECADDRMRRSRGERPTMLAHGSEAGEARHTTLAYGSEAGEARHTTLAHGSEAREARHTMLAHGIETGGSRSCASAKIVIVGAGGGREDHLIGNVFRLLDFAERVPDVAMLTNAGRFDVVKGERTFECAPGQAVSVFAPIPGTKVASEGLEWPLGGADLSRLWSGTLNRASAREFSIRSSAPVLVYTARGI